MWAVKCRYGRGDHYRHKGKEREENLYFPKHKLNNNVKIKTAFELGCSAVSQSVGIPQCLCQFF